MRPMDFGEILDSSVRLYRKNFLLIVIAHLPVPLFYLGNNVLNIVAWGVQPFSVTDVLNPMAQPEVYADFSTLMTALLVSLLLGAFQLLIVQPMAISAAIKVVSDSILQNEPSVKSAYRYYFRNWWRLGLTNLVLFIALVIIVFVIGFIIAIPLSIAVYGIASAPYSMGALGAALVIMIVLLIIGVIFYAFFWTRLQETFPVAVNEGRYIISGLRRSWNLVKGRTLVVFFVLFLFSLIPFIITGSPLLFELVLGERLTMVTVVAGTLSQCFLIPLVYTARNVLYFDSRARKEGFDLEKRVEELPE